MHSFDRLVEDKQSGLIDQKLPHNNHFLVALGRLRPVRANMFAQRNCHE
jgi:hypothetical protein